MHPGLLALVAMNLAVAPICTEDCEPAGGGGAQDLELLGHSFLFPALARNAFVTTHLSFEERAELLHIPQLPVGQLGPQDLRAGTFTHTLELGVRFTPWLGVDVTAAGRVVTGVGLGSLVGVGATADGALSGSPVLRLLRSEETGTQLSVRLLGGHAWTERAEVTPLIEALTSTPFATLRTVYQGNLGQLLLVPTQSTDAGLGVYLAQALGPIASLQLSAAPEYTWLSSSPYDVTQGVRIDASGHAFRVISDGMLTVDLQRAHVPIALEVEAQFIFGREDAPRFAPADVRVLTLSGGVFYSGRRNLQVGVVGAGVVNAPPVSGTDTMGNPALSGTPSLLSVQLDFRYVW